ncbi:MAG: LPS assembly lipoprotein LptE [Verrucomicrobiales bacterium]|nr:LPS assembly lipoprotein LptE [Verrucomicrobiales bacterium]
MKPVSSLSFLALICGALVSLSGCAGYQLGGAKPASYSGINNIFIPSFKNSTLEPRLSSLVTNAVLKEVQADGTYKVTNRANCDAVLMGTIADVTKTQLRAEKTNTLESTELSVRLICDFYLADPNTGKRITGLQDKTIDKAAVLSEERSYDPLRVNLGRVYGSTIQVVDESFQVGERGALAIAAEDLATQLVSQLSNGW